MEIGIVGLGRMGANMARRLLAGGHRVIGYDRDPEIAGGLEQDGFEAAGSLSDVVEKTPEPRPVWLMLPAGSAVDAVIEGLLPALGNDAILIDGGNSNYKDTLRRHGRLAAEGVSFLDVGTSGGIWGARDGYCLMIGGAEHAVERLRPVFETLAPAPDAGWGRVGPGGAGHFVKMIHNGIEYGMMQAYGEGFAILREKAEFDLDLSQIAELWNQGGVVRSWLLELAGRALRQDSGLSSVGAQVEDSGEGRWTVEEAVELDVAAPIITLSLIARLGSRHPDAFSNKVVAALRQQFGGHAVAPGE